MPTIAIPNVLQEPGYLLTAPLGSSLPTNTIVGSKFTDAWPGAWLSFGATADGTEFSYEIKVEPIKAAEFLDPIKWATTDRSGNVSFTAIDWTLTNLQRVMNGGTLAVISGSGSTQLNQFDPPAAGAEVRRMIGWESLDGTLRGVFFQCLNGGTVKSEFKKSPAIAGLACTFNFEIPTTPAQPFRFWSAGTARA